MKRFFLFATFVALIATSCSQFAEEDTIALPSRGDKFTAYFDEDASRTYVEQNKYMRWHEGDLLSIFFASTLNRQYKFDGKTGDNSGTFTEVDDKFGAGNSIDRNYALYPYNAATTFDDATNTISATLPVVQQYAENSFGRGANTMVAVTESVADKVLSFKNVCGYLKLQLYGEATTIKSIVLNGNNGEKLAGAGVITAAYGEEPTIAMAEAAGESVTLECGEGVTIGATAEEATTFWFALPPTTFEGGITITATNTDGGVFEKSTTNEVIIARNVIQPMAAVEVECELAKPANNEIWYTNGSTTSKTTPYYTDVFGANIESNTYDAEKECWVITFDADVTSIGRYAFNDCSSLTSVTIPDSVTWIGNNAFYDCSSLTSVTIPDSVTSIGEKAFYNCSSLTSVTIGDSVTSIGRLAFYGCTGELIINGKIVEAGYTGSTYPTNSYSGWLGGAKFTKLTIGDSITKIGDYAFLGCSSLTSVTIGNSVTSIGDYAFDGCGSLTSITIPDSVTSIGGWAFYNCSSLTTVTIPDSVTEIGRYAFSRCSSLTSVTIPDGVTSIGSYAFAYCSSLTSVTIPDSVTEIGSYAFSGCSSLTSVYCKPTTPPTGGYDMFSYYNNGNYHPLGCNIYVPTASVEAYKAAEYWSDYKDYIFGTDSFDLPPFGSEEGEMAL